MKTSIVILTYNQWDLTKKCFDSILKYTNMDEVEMIIIDNGSTDGTRDHLRDFPSFNVVLNEENKGFAGGCNQGLRMATGDNVLFLNNDTIVTENWLDSMISLLYSDEAIGMVGPVSNYVSGGQRIPFDYTDISGIDEFAARYCAENKGKSKRVLRLVGFCLLAKKSVLDEADGFDERYGYGSFEDDDLCVRTLQAGYQSYIALDSFVHHHGHATFTANQINMSHLYVENRARYAAKWGIDLTYFMYPRPEIVALVPSDAKRILDVGCGAGATGLEIMYTNPGSELYGIEINDFVAELAKKHYKGVESTDVETLDLPFPEEYFDVILCNDVLEHLCDPWKVVQKLARHLKPSGYIIGSIPNITHAEALLPLMLGSFPYTDAGILDRTHLRFFTPQTVHSLFPADVFESFTKTHVTIPPNEMAKKFFHAIGLLSQQFGFHMNQLAEYSEIYQMLVKVRKKSVEKPIE